MDLIDDDSALEAKERALKERARELEREMQAIKKQKMQSLLKQFQVQLSKDTELEARKLREELDQKFVGQVTLLDAELSS